MTVLDVLSPRTRRRHAHVTKPPTLVHIDRATRLNEDKVPVFSDLSLRIRAGQRWVLFCKEQEAITALLQCLAGLQQPEQGAVTIRGHVSWPLGQVAGVSNKLSCAENCRFLAGIYGQRGQINQDLALVEELMALQREQWLRPLVKLPSAVKTRLKLALSLAFDFDLYLIDASGLQHFRRTPLWTDTWQGLLEQRLRTRAVLSAGLIPMEVGGAGAKGLVLVKGQLVKKGSLAECQDYWTGQLDPGNHGPRG